MSIPSSSVSHPAQAAAYSTKGPIALGNSSKSVFLKAAYSTKGPIALGNSSKTVFLKYNCSRYHLNCADISSVYMVK
jgi:hypothetical protein